MLRWIILNICYKKHVRNFSTATFWLPTLTLKFGYIYAHIFKIYIFRFYTKIRAKIVRSTAFLRHINLVQTISLFYFMTLKTLQIMSLLHIFRYSFVLQLLHHTFLILNFYFCYVWSTVNIVFISLRYNIFQVSLLERKRNIVAEKKN